MKYLRLHISTDSKGMIYEKDVHVRSAFDSFVRSHVRSLVRHGYINRGEHYSARIIPRYGDTLIRNPVINTDAGRVNQESEWIDMEFEEQPRPLQPVRYFTLELWIRERNLIYRQDVQMVDIGQDYVTYGIEAALIGMGVLRPGEIYRMAFYARDDDEAQFDKERLPSLERDSASLVEFLSDVPDALSFPPRDVRTYEPVTIVGQPAADDVRIYVRRQLIGKLKAEAMRSDLLQVELGGILVGDVFEDVAGGRPIVEINELIVSEDTLSSITQLRYTFESWQKSNTELRTRFPGKRIVGWYHTHLVQMAFYNDATRQEMELTTMFFSRDDVFLHSQFFREEWYVAMVWDPYENSIFFQWKNGEVVACGGYHIFEDVTVVEAG